MKKMSWLGVLGLLVCTVSAEEVKQDGPLITVDVRFIATTGTNGLEGVDVFSTKDLPKHMEQATLRVVARSGQQGSSKIATEYIYPKDFELHFGSIPIPGEPKAIVEPQNFVMQEVGFFVDATPTWNPEDDTIDLDITPAIVGEPTWHGFIYVDEQGKRLLTEDGWIIELPMERPHFPMLKVSRKLKLQDGAHTVFGGFKDETGALSVFERVKDEAGTKKRTFYFVVKATVIKPLAHPEW